LRPGRSQAIVALLLCACASPAAAQAYEPKTDWEKAQEERDWKETEISLPAVPTGKGLLEFFVSSASSFKFYVDPQSLSVSADGVVRYAMVARSAAGVETVSFEGIRCQNETYRIYAFVSGGAWKRNDADWRPIEPTGMQQRWHNVLRSEYFCPKQIQITTAAEGIDALRRGGHPSVRRF
jgi:CNP1-like family